LGCHRNIGKGEPTEESFRVELINIDLRDTIICKTMTYFWM
jgi:hypothetical protein